MNTFTHQSLIPNFVFLKTVDMAKEDVLRFLPKEVIDKYFPPADDARYIKAKRKTIRIPDAREKF